MTFETYSVLSKNKNKIKYSKENEISIVFMTKAAFVSAVKGIRKSFYTTGHVLERPENSVKWKMISIDRKISSLSM